MNKQLLLVAMIMALVGVNGCSAMVLGFRKLRLFVDDPKVKIIIPESFYNLEGTVFTDETYEGTIFSIPDIETVGVQFPGEDEPHDFDLNQLGLNGPLTITVITKDKNQNSVELEDGYTKNRIIFIENK